MKTKAITHQKKVLKEKSVIVNTKELSKMKKVTVISFIIMIIIVAIAVFKASSDIRVQFKLMRLQQKYEKLLKEHEILQEKYEDLKSGNTRNLQYIDECKEQIVALTEINSELEKQNKSLASSNEEYYNKIQEYTNREELFDKYEYALIRKDGSRTDITYDQLKTVEELCEEKDIDTDLILSICMVESSGTEKARNSTSTASGYGQILAGTGKYVYEKVMKAGVYNHQLALDGDTNLQMMVNYIDYLDNRSGSLYKVIESYRGDPSDLSSYISKIDGYLAKKNKSVDSLN